MELILCYIFPESENVVKMNVDLDAPYFSSWLHSQLESSPDVNFFYVTLTTDIFEDEVDPDSTASYQFWVSEPAMGLESVNDQMRFLNSMAKERPDSEFIGCDSNGHYIFKMPVYR